MAGVVGGCYREAVFMLCVITFQCIFMHLYSGIVFKEIQRRVGQNSESINRIVDLLFSLRLKGWSRLYWNQLWFWTSGRDNAGCLAKDEVWRFKYRCWNKKLTPELKKMSKGKSVSKYLTVMFFLKMLPSWFWTQPFVLALIYEMLAKYLSLQWDVSGGEAIFPI